MTQMPIDVFIELISHLNISVDFKVAPRVTRMIFASVFDKLCHCGAEISFFFFLVAIDSYLNTMSKEGRSLPSTSRDVKPVPSTIDWSKCFNCQRDGRKEIRCAQQIMQSCHKEIRESKLIHFFYSNYSASSFSLFK